jgi:hypothetical protein
MSSKPTTSPSENRFSGSLSPCDSIILQENFSEDSFRILPCNLIPYESVCGIYFSKEIQTENESFIENSQEMLKIIQDLTIRCKKYKKQNSELRKEIKAVQEQKENDQVRALQEEVSRLKGKIQVHQMMAEKIVFMFDQISEDFEPFNETGDFRVYSAILMKIDVMREKFREFEKTVKRLENDKISMTELINFYTSTTKLLKNKSKEIPGGVCLTPDILNHVYTSRKSSSLSENTLNTIRNHIIRENNAKGSLHADGNKNEDLGRSNCFRSTLKGQKDEKTGKKGKNRTSTSPLIPKPQKNCMKAAKEIKSNALRPSKTIDEDTKRRKRYKS